MFGRHRTAQLAADPAPSTSPQFTRENVINACIIATLSAGALAATLYAPRWPIPCAIIALFIVAFASVLRISLVTTNVITPTVRIVSNAPLAHVDSAAQVREQEVVSHAPVTVVTVSSAPLVAPADPPPFVVAAAPPKVRNPRGQYATGEAITETLPPLRTE